MAFEARNGFVHVFLPPLEKLEKFIELVSLMYLYLDPTNDQLTDESHATVALGRDYADVTSGKGVIFTQAKKSKMAVSVDLAPISPETGPGV